LDPVKKDEKNDSFPIVVPESTRAEQGTGTQNGNTDGATGPAAEGEPHVPEVPDQGERERYLFSGADYHDEGDPQ
jgi:hypothetical protein